MYCTIEVGKDRRSPISDKNKKNKSDIQQPLVNLPLEHVLEHESDHESDLDLVLESENWSGLVVVGLWIVLFDGEDGKEGHENKENKR